MGAFIAIGVAILALVLTPLIGIGLTVINSQNQRKKLLTGGHVTSGGVIILGSVYGFELQEKVFNLFIKKFKAAFSVERTFKDKIFGLKSLELLQKNLIIEWVPGIAFTQRNLDNKPFEEGHPWHFLVQGQMVGRFRAVVADNDGKGLYTTAFIHELCHWALDITAGDADPDHEKNVLGTTWTQEINEFISTFNQEVKKLEGF